MDAYSKALFHFPQINLLISQNIQMLFHWQLITNATIKRQFVVKSTVWQTSASTKLICLLFDHISIGNFFLYIYIFLFFLSKDLRVLVFFRLKLEMGMVLRQREMAVEGNWNNFNIKVQMNKVNVIFIYSATTTSTCTSTSSGLIASSSGITSPMSDPTLSTEPIAGPSGLGPVQCVPLVSLWPFLALQNDKHLYFS